jgi:hypothetical protein
VLEETTEIHKVLLSAKTPFENQWIAQISHQRVLDGESFSLVKTITIML